ncbi:autoinducer binding domain-containing protein [Gymnodinialimonas sp. 2305UL16-5]|uniref:autoinducer binding domain-containing protein n=1 Tax=Gymnodinialimonas mytili TaxID=3126503 RepID=UPI0030AE6621
MNWFVDLLDDLISEGGEFNPSKIEELREARARLASEGAILLRNRATDRLIAQIEDTDTIDQLAAAFATIPPEFGFDGATLVVLKEGETCLSRRVISTLPDAWWDDYHALNLNEDDPLINGILAREHELFIDEIMPKDPNCDEPMRYLKCAEAHLIGCNGVIFKVGYSSGLVAAMVLNTVRQPDYVRRQFRKYRDDLHVLTQAVCDALVYFSRLGTHEQASLTADEIHFLRLVAKSADPSSALAKSARYGSAQTIQNQVMRKLGVTSIFQAILIATRQGYLDHAIVHPEEIIRTRPQVTGWDLVSDAKLTQPQSTSSAVVPRTKIG